MGIIQKQALRSTVVNFVGIGFGAISRIILPFLLTTAQVGVLALLEAVSGVFVVLFNLGYVQITLKMFPSFRNEEKGHSGFFMFGMFISIAGILLGITSYYFLENFILKSKTDSGEILKSFAYLIPLLIIFRVLFMNIDGYVRMLFKTVFGIFLESFFPKFILLAGTVFFWLKYINFEYLIYIYVVALSVPGVLIVVYAIYKTKKITLPKKVLFETKNRKKIKQYMLYGILIGASGSIVLYVDQLMIHNMISIEQVGVYSVMFFAATLINIPARGLSRISAVMIAESWKENDTENIQEIYQKSCLNQLIIGFYLFIVGWYCLDSVLYYLPEYSEGKYVFFFLGLGQVIDMATGVNTAILVTSEKYKYNTYFNIFLAVLVIGLNFVFIENMGIVGAGLASFFAMLIVNTAKWFFLKKTYNFQPFNWTFVKAVIIAIVVLLLFSLVSVSFSPIYTILFNFSILSIIYWGVIIRLHVSVDINQWLTKMKKTLLKRP